MPNTQSTTLNRNTTIMLAALRHLQSAIAAGSADQLGDAAEIDALSFEEVQALYEEINLAAEGAPKLAPTSNFIVQWNIESNADTPLQAAREAFETLQDCGTETTVFHVQDRAGNTTVIDLYDTFEEEEEEEAE